MIKIATLCLMLGLLLSIQPSHAQETEQAIEIRLDIPQEIMAGEDWIAHIEIIGDPLPADLTIIWLNGIAWHTDTVSLAGQTHTTFVVPAQASIYAGDSMFIVQANGQELRHVVTVHPQAVVTVDAFPTSNTIKAYGLGQARILAIPRDEFGNLNVDHSILLALEYPDLSLIYVPSLANRIILEFPVNSAGSPGRIIGSVSVNGEVLSTIRITQSPVEAATITLEVRPSCLRGDSQDVLIMDAVVYDDYGNLVADGTSVFFDWGFGAGTAPTSNGVSTLRLGLPYAERIGITAYSGIARSKIIKIGRDCDVH